MGRFIAKVLIAAFALWLAATIVPGIDYDTWLTLPITLLTLGLFLLVVNAAMIGLVGLILPGFTVAGFWPAVFAAVVTGMVSWVGQGLMQDR